MGTITKALNLLYLFSTSRPEIGLSEFRQLTSQDKATVHRHLTELNANGFLEQNPINRKYRLGPAILRLAAVRERLVPMRETVAPIVDRMSEELGELVHVCLRQDDALSPLYYHEAHQHGTRVGYDESIVLPMHATASGLAVLAYSNDDLLDEVLAGKLTTYTGFTVTNPDALRGEVDKARQHGFATSNQGFEADVFSFAVPFFDALPDPKGSVSVAIPVSRRSDELTARIIAALKSGGTEITSALGGTLPHDIKRIWSDAK